MMHHGDALEFVRGLADASVDAVVTDPPYCSGGLTEAARRAGIGQGLRSENLRRDGWFGGDNMGTGAYHSIVPPPPARCTSCGAVEARNPFIQHLAGGVDTALNEVRRLTLDRWVPSAALTAAQRARITELGKGGA